MTKHVVIGAGHRHTLGEAGNTFEKELNGKKVRAILDEFDRQGGVDRLGFTLFSYTPDRGLGLFPGYLNEAPKWGLVNCPQPADLMTELHSEGAGGKKGAFAIFPDRSGDRDRDIATHGAIFPEALHAAVSAIGIRDMAAPGGHGTMSERQTNVAITLGARLGVFRDTAQFGERVSRTIFEQGAHDHPAERNAMESPTFLLNQARAYLTAVARFFDVTAPGWRSTPAPVYTPSQVVARAVAEHGMSWQEIVDAGRTITVGGVVLTPDHRRMEARRAAVCRSDFSDTAGMTRDKLVVGEDLTVAFKAKVGVNWKVSKYGTCIRSSALKAL